MKRTYYKVVRNDNGVLKSVIGDDEMVTFYHKNVWAYPNRSYSENLNCLFVFKDEQAACNFRHQEMSSFWEIWKCEIGHAFGGCLPKNSVPTGTVFTDKVKLIRKISN